MAFYQIIQTQKIPATMDQVWDFISKPGNLKKITPASMDFVVTSTNGNDPMYAGMIITYVLKPMLGIRTKWMTEITHVQNKEYFVDEQRLGPYKMWHHQHKIQPVAGGVLMTDIVTYIPPFGWLGAIANSLFIRKKLKQIFDFRTTAVETAFGKWKE